MDNKTYIKIKRNSRKTIISVEGQIPLFESKRGEYHVVQCPLFKTLGYSKLSIEEARNDHSADLDIFLQAHIDRGSLIIALHTLGWERHAVGEHYISKGLPPSLLNQSTHTHRFAA